MSPSNFDITVLDQFILEIVKSRNCTEEQAWQLGKYYEQAKLCCLHGDIKESLAILGAIRRIPDFDLEVNKLRLLAEGFSDAIYTVQCPTYLPAHLQSPQAQGNVVDVVVASTTSEQPQNLKIESTNMAEVEPVGNETEVKKDLLTGKQRQIAPVDDF